MKVVVALLIALSIVLGAIVQELESRPPVIVRTPAAEELPWAIMIDHCDEMFAMIWTTEPPTWFTPKDNFDAAQKFKMDLILLTGQHQLINVCPKGPIL